MNLLTFFAFPIATIIISIILQKLIKNPILVAAFIFAVFLIVTFAAFDEMFLIATLVYTLISLITAFIVCIFCNNNDDDNDNDCVCNTISDLLSNNTNNNNNNNTDNTNNNGCGCGCSRFRRR